MAITQDYLDNILSNSLYQDELEHILNIEKDGSAVKDYGTFLGLSEPCSISLEIIDPDERPAPNMDAESLQLSPKEKQKIFNILSSHNFDVTLSEADPSKIYISDTGLKLPYLKSDEALAMLSDVVDELKANDINIYGYAHPKVKSSFVKCVEDTGYYRDNVDSASHADKSILGNQSFEDFVSKQLKNAENNVISEDDINKYTKENYGKSIYRGGTTGNNPYAVLSRACTKDFLYGSSDFATAKRYSGELRSYKPVDGKQYGFLYEYEAAPNQKYYNDYQIENGIKGFDISGASIGCETPIYEHRNKLKGIYLNVDGKICKIANENGYLSKDWENFAKLHTLEFTVRNPVERDRQNALLELAAKNETANSYTKRNYHIQQISPEDYNDKYISKKHDYLPSVLLTGTVNQDILDKFSDNVILRNAALENVNSYDGTLSGDIHLKDHVSLETLKLKNAHLKSDKPLDVKDIYASGKISLDNMEFTNNVDVIGNYCEISDSYLPKNVNLENVKNLTISGKTHFSEGCKLPDNVTFDNADIKGNINLENVNMILKGDVTFDKNVKLPEKLPYYPNLKSITISEEALAKTTIPDSYFTIITDDNNKPKAILYNENNTLHRMLAEKNKELARFNSVESYKKCKETEKLLTSWGIDKDSYMMFTKDDNLHTTYNDGSRSIKSYFEDGAKEIANTQSKVVYGRNNGVVAAYFDNDVYIISKDEKLADKLYYKGNDVGLGVMLSNGEQLCDQYRNLDKARNDKWLNIDKKVTEQPEPAVKTAANENTPELKETLKQQTETAQQAKNAPAKTPAVNGDLHNTLKAQKESSGLGSKVSAVSNSIDNTLEKAGKVLNDNAAGRTINKIDSWRPKNKVGAKVVGAAGVVPTAAIAATGVTAYEQYKSGDKKGAAATMAKGTVHAAIQGAATAGGMNLAAKGLSKGTEKVVTKVAEHNLTKKAAQKATAKAAEKAAEKAATKAAVKAGAKAAGKAAGKAVLKKIPLVSLGAGLYFAYERAKKGEWGKAVGEVCSGAAGCVPGVGTLVSTGIDCGLAVADTKQAINETKKQQAAEQAKKAQAPKPQQKPVTAQRVAELRGIKTAQSQQKPASEKKQQKPIEKGVWNKLTNLFSR